MGKRLANRIDLNLLEVFVEIYRRRNLTHAGVALGLSQPAMSRALGRLRDAYGDRLFVRLPQGLAPTPCADEVYEAASAALAIVTHSLDAPAFDPATSQRELRIAMSDTGEQVFLPVLARALAQAAPGMRLRTRPSDAATLVQDLAAGTTDLGIGYLDPAGDGVCRESLFTARYACIARRDHPGIGRRLTARAFRQLSHVVVTSPSTAHAGAVVEALQAPAVAAPIALKVASFLSLGPLISQTDYLATIPRTLALSLESAWAVRCHVPPIDLGTYDVVQCWHERFARDPALVWFRALVRERFRR